MEPLIESVRKYPCLWNTAAIEYRDQELKDAAWAEVMKETDMSSVKEVKLKWKKLRDSYRDALKREGAAGGARRPCPWKYTALMAFLQPHMGARRRPPDAPPPANGRASPSSASSSSSSEPAAKRRPPPAAAPPAAAAAPPAAAPAPDPLDLFFSGMCQATKRLGYGAQLKVKRALFEAVAAGEEALLAEQAGLAALWARARSSSSDDDAPPIPRPP